MKRILIVGGGSAGWITASYLNATLNSSTKKSVEISLIAAPDIGRIGVGEATVPNIRGLLNSIGIDEQTFMREADATFKSAIKFVNWRQKDGHQFYHPFDKRNTEEGEQYLGNWLASDRNIPFDQAFSVLSHLCESGHAPKAQNWPDYGSPFAYAYHMDAEKFAGALCKFSIKRGVEYFEDQVVDVEVNEAGIIQWITTKSGQQITADLFVDCTGFGGLLIDKTLGDSFISYADTLLCDRAVTMRVPYDVYYPGSIKPYTTSTALNAGWVWDIGLSDRRGIGYVYASSHLSSEQAEAELIGHEGLHAQQIATRHLSFKVGRRTEFWKGNCVAIGLSSGFIEPLESTALYMVGFAATALADLFDTDPATMPVMAKRFNRLCGQLYEEVLEFVNLHYCLNQRNDTAFWREVRDQKRIVASLQEKLQYWKYKRPSLNDFEFPYRLFSVQSYEHILYGMGFASPHHFPPDGQPAIIAEPIKRAVQLSRDKFVAHESWLQQKLGLNLPDTTGKIPNEF